MNPRRLRKRSCNSAGRTGASGKCRSIDDKGGEKNGKKRKPGANFLSAEKKEKTTHFLPHFESTSESINGAEELRTF